MGAYPRLAYIRYTRGGGASGGGVVAVAAVRLVAAVVAVAAVRLVAASWPWPITTHDTFISSKARNAQYSTALPYVK